MVVAFTGHRPNKLENDYNLTSEKVKNIGSKIISIINEFSDVQFIVGGALGIDTLAALIAINLKIPFTVAVPCRNQDKMWPQKSKDVYRNILLKASSVHLVSDTEYNYSCMQKRNEWMVDNCDVLIAVWDGTSGGTANCIKYAKSVNKKIIIINI